jgi:branched-chain amino acid transport system permease protein
VLEGLRTVLQTVNISQEWRLVVAPALLVLLMIFRPRGMMGLREFRLFTPPEERPDAIDALRGRLQSAPAEAPESAA